MSNIIRFGQRGMIAPPSIEELALSAEIDRAAKEDAVRLGEVQMPDLNREAAVADLEANPQQAAQYAAPLGEMPPMADWAEMDAGVQAAPKPAPKKPKAPAMDAGPEVLKPGPGEERQEGAPQAAQARAKPVPVPADTKLRERYLDTVWPQIKHFAAGRGINANVLRDVYDNAADQGGHRAGVLAIQGAIKGVRTEVVADHRKQQIDAEKEDAQARRMNIHPAAMRHYQSMRQSSPQDLVAHLIMLHQQYPMYGFGNLAALEMRNQAGNQQAQALQVDNQKPVLAQKQDENLQFIVNRGPGPATLPALREHWKATQQGAANPGGSDKFAQEQSLTMYKPLHGNNNLTPDQAAFVNQYVRSFRTYQDFRAHNDLEDTPENRAWWTRITQKPAATLTERLTNTVTDAGNFVGGAIKQGYDAITKPKPRAENVAQNGKPGRRPFDKP